MLIIPCGSERGVPRLPGACSMPSPGRVPAAPQPPVLPGVCKTRPTALCGGLGGVSAQLNRAVGWDTAMTSQRVSRWEISDISERLQLFGERAAAAGGPGPGATGIIVWRHELLIVPVSEQWAA